MKLLLLLLILVLVGLYVQRFFIGFMAQSPTDYADTGPAFDMRVHLGGEMISEGLLFGPSGKVATRFVATMSGKWEGNRATLAEAFRYSSGGTQLREWAIVMGEGGAFTATASDVIGVAQGQVSGATVRMTYRLQLSDDAGGHVLDVVDWLYLVEDGSILNKSEMRKFGVKVAELIATIRPATP
jgi:Protein of unknown function (DUF3833)